MSNHIASLCLLIKDENEYLSEWLDWHFNLGVDHVYIYDNNSKVPIIDTINILNDNNQNRITVVQWNDYYQDMQVDCYNHCLQNYGHESKWIAFIDSDEFIRINEQNSIGDFLMQYNDCGALYMCWTLFNANGQITKENGLVRDRFTNILEEHDMMGIGKSFVQPSKVKKMKVHLPVLKKGFKVFNENMVEVNETRAPFTCDKITVDHYLTKSLEEWLFKIKRGSSIPLCNRSKYDFIQYNQGMNLGEMLRGLK